MARAATRSPKYRRIAEILGAELRAGAPVPRPPRAADSRALAPLESEAELVERFRVSRITVRLALAILQQQGLIHRAQGRRTYATPPKLVRHLHPPVTFEEDMAQQRVHLVTEVAHLEKARPAAWARAKLRVTARRRALRLVLKRLVGGICVCYDERYLVPAVAEAFTPTALTEHSTREILSAKLGLLLTHLGHETEVAPADRTVADAMGLVPGTLVMQNTYVSYADGAPVEVGRASYRVDRCRFSFAERHWKT
ncbi:MAG: GntR family transcriptional regulator [Candidatus Rokubacteria bacterium]|nr:GntR family transcriptional regulator [Candidatus Rokubacteria bacterium]